MVWRGLLLAAVGAVTVLASLGAAQVAAADGTGCIPADSWAGCPDVETEVVDGGVDLTADGSSGGGAAGESDGDPEGGAALPLPAAPPAPLSPEETNPNDNRPPTRCTDAPDVCDPQLVLSWSDIASFRATPPVLTLMEPAGWAVKGLPMNLVAAASVEEIAGSLLGFPAEVRFTPTAFAWNYGDSHTGRTPTGGASWAELGLPEFSATSTSHVYGARGEYSVTVGVELIAEYRFGGGQWRPIAGSVGITGGAASVAVKSATTVLVSGSCLQNPHGPGC
jgi:hypothetical protein